MDYPDFNRYWFGLNEAEETGTNTVNPTDPYEYKREGAEGSWAYYTRKKGSENWIQVTDSGMISSIESQIEFKAADVTPTEEFLTGDVAKNRLAVTRPEWVKVLISEYPFAMVDQYNNYFLDDKGKLRYSEDVMGKTMFNYSQEDDPNFSTGFDFDPAAKPAGVLDNPFWKGAATMTTSTTATTTAAVTTTPDSTATTTATTPTTPKQEVDQLKKEIQAAKEELRSARKDARVEKKLERLEKRKERLEGKMTSESSVYSFAQFVKFKNKF
jgi:hypothetical protein